VAHRVISPLPADERLTRRESEILSWLGQGKDVPSIAIILNISPNTVEVHVSNLMRKLDLHNRAEVVLAAIERDLAPCPCANCRLKEAA
jgi:DNA-binding NarL/FixJ family response regulator